MDDITKKQETIKRHVNFALLDNGLDFIFAALEDLSGQPNPRQLKYATLHLASGVELILKKRLRREHWSLIFKSPDKAKRECYISGSFQSVSWDDAIDRLKNICEVTIDRKHLDCLKILRDRRNRLEHFAIKESIEAFKATAADTLNFVTEFLEKELKVNKKLNQIHRSLSEFELFVQKRWREIKSKVDKFEIVLTCPRCHQKALGFNPLKCAFCGYKGDGRSMAEQYISSVLKMKRFEYGPIHNCPECFTDSLIECREPDEKWSTFVCFHCGQRWDDLYKCPYCAEYSEGENCFRCAEGRNSTGEI